MMYEIYEIEGKYEVAPVNMDDAVVDDSTGVVTFAGTATLGLEYLFDLKPVANRVCNEMNKLREKYELPVKILPNNEYKILMFLAKYKPVFITTILTEDFYPTRTLVVCETKEESIG